MLPVGGPVGEVADYLVISGEAVAKGSETEQKPLLDVTGTRWAHLLS